MPTIKVGGVERTLLNIVQELAKRDYRLTLLTSAVPDHFRNQLPTSVEVKLIGTSNRLPFLFKFFSPKVRTALNGVIGLVRFIRNEKPDAIYSFQTSTLAVAARMVARTNSRLYVRESNTASQSFIFDGRFSRKIKLTLKKLLYSRANAIIAVSAGVANDLETSVGISRSNIRVIYNPTFTPQLLELSKEPVDHHWLKADSNVPVIISVGRLSKQKDFLTLIKAFAIARSSRKMRLLIVGEGPERAEIERCAASLGITTDVDLIGEQQNPYKYLSRSSVFVLSSIFEGLPNVVIEAVGCRLPVVATDCPSGPREILMNGDSGTLVPIADPEKMAEAILSYLAAPSLAVNHVDTGYKALERFTPQRASDAYVGLITESNN
jgi:glycosyltransferase involved in cell wall biosynthesis